MTHLCAYLAVLLFAVATGVQAAAQHRPPAKDLPPTPLPWEVMHTLKLSKKGL